MNIFFGWSHDLIMHCPPYWDYHSLPGQKGLAK
jgi:hypothetical protein